MVKFNNTWINIELITDTTQAFVYLITIEKNGEDKYYIGYKSIISGWKNYISSSDYIKADKEFITKKIILEVFDDKDKAHARESFLIRKFNAVKSDNFYNRQDKGEKFNITGQPKTDKQTKHNNSKDNISHLQVISKAAKERNSRKCKDKNGVIYKQVAEAATKNNIVYGTLVKRCKGDIDGWSYIEPQKIIKTKKAQTAHLVKKCISPEGIIYESVREASIKTGIKYDTLKTKCRRQMGWRYDGTELKSKINKCDIKRKTDKKCMCHNGIIFDKVSDAARHYGINKTTARLRCVNGIIGWKFI